MIVTFDEFILFWVFICDTALFIFSLASLLFRLCTLPKRLRRVLGDLAMATWALVFAVAKLLTPETFGFPLSYFVMLLKISVRTLCTVRKQESLILDIGLSFT